MECAALIDATGGFWIFMAVLWAAETWKEVKMPKKKGEKDGTN